MKSKKPLGASAYRSGRSAAVMPGNCREAWVVRRRRESVWFKRAQIGVADRVADRRRSPTLFHDFLQEHAEVGMMAVSAMQELGNETARTLLRPLEARAHELYRAVIDDALEAGIIRARSTPLTCSSSCAW